MLAHKLFHCRAETFGIWTMEVEVEAVVELEVEAGVEAEE